MQIKINANSKKNIKKIIFYFLMSYFITLEFSFYFLWNFNAAINIFTHYSGRKEDQILLIWTHFHIETLMSRVAST